MGFPVLALLGMHCLSRANLQMTVGKLAEALRITQPSVSQTPIDRIEKILDQKSVLERALGYLDNAKGKGKRLARGLRR